MILISDARTINSLDGDRSSLFTETLKVWRKGKFEGGYRVPPGDRPAHAADAKPNFFRAGKVSKAFELRKPFTIG